MNRRAFAVATFAVIAALVLGAFVGWTLRDRTGQALDKQRVDIARAIRAVDFDNRLSLLRTMRENNVPEREIRSGEVSAILLLEAIDISRVYPSDQSFTVLQNAANNLRRYMNDFAQSEFKVGNHKAVEQLLRLSSTRR